LSETKKAKRVLEVIEPEPPVSLTLKTQSGSNPIELDFSTPAKTFDVELSKLLLTMPILREKLESTSAQVGQQVGVLQGNTALITNDYVASNADFMILCNASAGAFTVTLPPAGAAGLVLVVVKQDGSANVVTVACFGTDLIEGSASLSLTSQWSKAVLVCDGSSHWIKLPSEEA
jgi:hypothetical protein